ncbi:MAG: sodium:proton antiporter [Campylobacterales bacterium]|nr:sodium:proton antiporter [Campylobacterales bacterium]
MALLTRQVFISLLSGIVLGELILLGGDLVAFVPTTLERLLSQFGEEWKIKTLFFVIMVGSIIRLITVSGAIETFVVYVRTKRIKTKRSTLLMGYFVGILIFLESSITALVVGTVTKPLAKCYKISNAKLAYLCDSTSSPVCSLFPFNGWGALLLGLIGVQIAEGVIEGNSLSLLVYAIPLNFYAIVTMLLLFLVIFTGRDFGAMKRAEQMALQEKEGCDVPLLHGGVTMKAMYYPVSVMLLSVPVFLYLSGGGNILEGSGSSAIFYSVLLTLVFISLYYRMKGIMSFERYFKEMKSGAGEMVGIGAVLLLAFALGEVTVALKTGPYLASLAEGLLNVSYLAAMLFVISALISFSTGTSWGTFSIMIPIALPMAAVLDAHLPLVIAAVISGGVFGDHCSPISDTTIISSMAADCDHIEHVRTQLPYALLSGGISLVLFAVFGYYY